MSFSVVGNFCSFLVCTNGVSGHFVLHFILLIMLVVRKLEKLMIQAN